ncbi:MAG: lipase maturation factor family protein [Acidimicrobiales bacterium]|nr:lipase maturation factor family protein [Acidimicrobiales bacterium]
MAWLPDTTDALARLLFQRGLALVYLIGFVVARNQFRGLLGSRGLTPIRRYVAATTFRQTPSIFVLRSTDRFFLGCCWVGIALSAAALIGVFDHGPIPATMAAWFVLWALYLSIVNVGQRWYAFGWESLLCEAGFLAVFLGPADAEVPDVVLVLLWWLLARVELGAGLIKLRGDPCWRDLTCLEYHHETQPMPNRLSRWFHHLPRSLHKIEVGANHLAQTAAPLLLLAPQPIRSWAAVLMIVTQGYLMLSGNFAWLNLLTIVLAFSALDGELIETLTGIAAPTTLEPSPAWFDGLTITLAVAVAAMSWPIIVNLASKHQRMNASFNPWRLVNTYGAFGSVTRQRHEIVIEGTADPDPGPDSQWHEYGFKGKPTDPAQRPRQVAPYHLRLDWILWFVPLSETYATPWLRPFLRGLLENDADILSLIGHNPFPDAPPTAVRALRYHYRFTTRAERKQTGRFWHRELLGSFTRPVTLSQPG